MTQLGAKIHLENGYIIAEAPAGLKGKDIFSLGKDATCDMRIDGRHVAKTKCHILARGGEHYLVHHAGWRRTTLNGQKIRGEQRLRRGDTIGIGGTKIRFE